MQAINRLRLLLTCLLLASCQALAQHSVYAGKPVQNASGRGIPASILVCSSTATGFPCSPLATIYTVPTPPSNPGAGTTIAGSMIVTDANGNFTFGCDPGLYVIQITVPGTTYNFVDTCPGVGAPTSGLTDPGSNGILKRTALNVTAIAASADIIALWTGSCSISTFLRGDGACAAVPAAGSNTSVQFNNSGVFGGSANHTWDNVNNTLFIGPVTARTNALNGIPSEIIQSQAGLNPLEIHSANSVGIDLYTHSNTGSTIPTLSLLRSDGSQTSPTVVNSDDNLGGISFGGYDGANYRQGGRLNFQASQNWTPTALGTKAAFSVVANGATSPSLAINIDNNTNVGIGNLVLSTLALFQLQTAPGKSVALGAASTSPTDGNIGNGQFVPWLDEANTNFVIRSKFSDATLHNVTIPMDVSLTTVYSCGTTSTCANTNITKPKIFIGSAPLVSGTPSTVTITGISPAFTSSSSYFCQVSEATNQVNNLLKVANVSSSSFTITGPNTITDIVNFHCIGN